MDQNIFTSQIVPISPKELPTSALAQTANYDLKMLTSVRNSAKVIVFESLTMIKSRKGLGQHNHIRAKSILVCCPKRPEPVDDKCKQPKEIDHAKPVSRANEIVSKVIAQNAGGATLPYHQDLMCSHTNVPWSQIDLSLAGPIQ
ncbi:hypothetical protein ACTXT7_008259 [Hymenolepis weldensis]